MIYPFPPVFILISLCTQRGFIYSIENIPKHCIPSRATSTAFSVEYKMAPAQSLTIMSNKIGANGIILTLLLICPRSQARATAYTYDRLAFNLVYMSAIFAKDRVIQNDNETFINKQIACLASVGKYQLAAQTAYGHEHIPPHNQMQLA